MGFSRQGYWSGLPFPSPGSQYLKWPSAKRICPWLSKWCLILKNAIKSLKMRQDFTDLKHILKSPPRENISLTHKKIISFYQVSNKSGNDLPQSHLPLCMLWKESWQIRVWGPGIIHHVVLKIKFCWNTARAICWYSPFVCLHATTWKVSSCNRDRTAHKAYHVYYLALCKKMFIDSCPKRQNHKTWWQLDNTRP